MENTKLDLTITFCRHQVNQGNYPKSVELNPQELDRQLEKSAGEDQQRNLQLTVPYMQGNNVRSVQKALAKVGYLTHADVDGIYKPKTKAAVEKFQSAQGLIKDGVAREKTRRALALMLLK